jgi:hypothetical protein
MSGQLEHRGCCVHGGENASYVPSTDVREGNGDTVGRVVIVAYKPKPGHAAALVKLTAEHLLILREQGLITPRLGIAMQAADGTVVEVFEWVSTEMIATAHTNAAVLELWKRYAEVCDYVPIGTVPEASKLFSEFTPIAVEQPSAP